MKHLTNPVLSDLNFLPEILQTLSARASPPSRSLALIRRLLLHSQHVAQSEAEIQLQLVSLASAGTLEEAYALVRDVGDDKLRSQLRERLWTWTLGAPVFAVGSGPVDAQKDVLRQLTHLPLDEEEVKHLGDFLKHPPRSIPPQNLSILHDLVTLRMVHQGQYADSIELDKASAESAGKDSDRQRRREMVREFIAILPEVQRRSLAIEGELTTSRREYVRETLVNGNVEMDEPMGRPATPLPAPAPLRANASSSNLAQVALPSSPAGNATPRIVSRPQSPFSGPPRFASTQQPSPDLRHRVMSGPFAPPRVVSNGSPAPKPQPKRLINDDDEEARPKARKPRRSFGPPRLPVAAEPRDEAPVEPEHEVEAEENAREEAPVPDAESGPSTRRSTRRSTRATSVASSGAPSEGPQANPPAPDSPPAHRTRRQTSQPPTPNMPGAFAQPQVEPPQAVPEHEVLRLEPESSAIGNGRPPTSKARTTRSVSGAQLDDEEDGKQAGGQRKKTRTTRTGRMTREQTADSTMPETPRAGRMSTRASTRASTVGPSEQGSPTPSIASVATEGRRRNMRAGSAVAQTPRQTRARRH